MTTRGVRWGKGLSRRADAGDETAGPVLRAVGLSRVHGQGESTVVAVDWVDLDIPTGQALAVTGPSGCGKSTLLQLLGGLDRPDGCGSANARSPG